MAKFRIANVQQAAASCVTSIRRRIISSIERKTWENGAKTQDARRRMNLKSFEAKRQGELRDNLKQCHQRGQILYNNEDSL